MNGIQLRDEGIKRVSAGFEDWLARARFLAAMIANREGEVTSDDVWKHCPLPPMAHVNLMGAVFRDRRFKAIGWRQSQRPSAHGRAIRIYSLQAYK
jgi:hypothetical protein